MSGEEAGLGRGRNRAEIPTRERAQLTHREHSAGTALKSCFELGQGGWVFIPGDNPSLDASLPPERDHELGEMAFFSPGLPVAE